MFIDRLAEPQVVIFVVSLFVFLALLWGLYEVVYRVVRAGGPRKPAVPPPLPRSAGNETPGEEGRRGGAAHPAAKEG